MLILIEYKSVRNVTLIEALHTSWADFISQSIYIFILYMALSQKRGRVVFVFGKTVVSLERIEILL